MGEVITLDDAIQESDQYYQTIAFVNSCYKFRLLDRKTEQVIQRELQDTFEDELGICDECQRTHPRCNCSHRWDRYDDRDDEYDRYNDR